MKTRIILSVALAILLTIAAIGGVYYYTNSSPQQMASPTPSPSLTTLPNQTSTPSGQPTSSATPSSSPGETPNQTNSSWTLSISNASANTTMGATLSHDYPKWIVTPENTIDTFLTVEFNLNASESPEPIRPNDILLVVDGNQEFQPLCLDDVFGNFQGSRNSTFTGLSINVTDGKITNNLTIANFTGIIDTQQATFQIEVQEQSGGLLAVARQTDTTNKFRFVYTIPKIYVDGTHNLQLRLTGFSNGQQVNVQPTSST
jgi:hypothetical protein